MADNLPPKFEDDDQPDTQVIKVDEQESMKSARDVLEENQSAAKQQLPPPAPPVLPGDPDSGDKTTRMISFGALGLGAVALLAALFLGSSGSSFSPSDIPDNSITGSKIATDAITPDNLSTAASEELQGPRGATGPAGPAGKNIVGSLQLEIVEKETSSTPTVTKKANATCPSGTRLISGGATITGGDDVFLSNSGPVVDLNDQAKSWTASAESLSLSNKQWLLTVTAICYKSKTEPSPSSGVEN